MKFQEDTDMEPSGGTDERILLPEGANMTPPRG
jgi:hypothetical protein